MERKNQIVQIEKNFKKLVNQKEIEITESETKKVKIHPQTEVVEFVLNNKVIHKKAIKEKK